MSSVVTRRLRRLVQELGPSPFAGRRIGVEKESLRVDRAGYISQRPHPAALGSALTHSTITTDFSEALLEFVTPAWRGVRETARSLRHLHQFTYPLIDDEVLWATSMPCMVTGDRSIPIARYGSSNVGTMKHVYRRGLSHRYGRVMQTISGVHFNFSLPRPFWAAFRDTEGRAGERLGAFASERYFALVRNFHRRGWLVPLLFGSSPAICRSFLGTAPHAFSELGRGTLYEPFATSLRMSDIGYKNKSQRQLGISYDSPADYIRTLHGATEAPHPPYEEIGVVVDGEHLQLNANLLQIENEYYSFVRPKQIARSGEKPTVALRRRGVRYVEIRALDVDPFSPVGLEEDTMRFMEAFLIHCVLDSSPPVTRGGREESEENQRLVAVRGRDPALRLRRAGTSIPVFEWAREIVDAVAAIAEMLDAPTRTRRYAEAIQSCRASLDDPQLLPSARVLEEMRARSEAFFEFAMRKSEEHRATLLAATLPAARKVALQAEAAASLRAQREIEAADRLSFPEYLERYFAQRPTRTASSAHEAAPEAA
ncbi:MAG: glutamate--cysteine ligase [Chromatiales bacterium]|nr:glutamate--cysteine ligase [Chromatiales bacterium]